MTKAYGVVIMAVTELVVTILACLWIGSVADKYFNKPSVFTATGAVAGCIIAFTRLVMRLQAVNNDSDNKS